MPSKSRKNFRDKLLPDVAAIIDSHRQLNPDGRGRRKLGHITRSGVLMLCAAWEIYIEDVLVESSKFLSSELDDPHSLPDRVKRRINDATKKNPHEFAVLSLSGEGWRELYVSLVRTQCEHLNTPKFKQISDLFYNWLGLQTIDLENAWEHTPDELDDFVTLRGEIAHRGADARYVKITELKAAKAKIDKLTVETDRFLATYLQSIAGKRPWRNT